MSPAIRVNGGNTNTPAISIAGKAFDLILGVPRVKLEWAEWVQAA